jgi:hypothetical protein
MRVALYLRVSREEQDSVNQLSQLQSFAAGLGQVVKTYDDCATGKNGDRPAFKAMLQDAAARRFDLVVFWALDRLTREGPLKMLCTSNSLRRAASSSSRSPSRCWTLPRQWVSFSSRFSPASPSRSASASAIERGQGWRRRGARGSGWGDRQEPGWMLAR